MQDTPPRLTVFEEPASALRDYARVPMAFESRTVLRVAPAQAGEWILTETTLEAPFTKDYDAGAGGPTSWPRRFDLSGWRFFGAYADEERVGSAAVILRSTTLEMLDWRTDPAVLWDIRVAPAARRAGVGAVLLDAVERNAFSAGARWLEVETQDINVPACRFYHRHGFRLRTVNQHAYPELPHETQLLWYKELGLSADPYAP